MKQFSKCVIGFFVMQLVLFILFVPLGMAMSEPGCFDCDAGPEFSPLTALLAVLGTALVAFLIRKRIVQNTRHN